MTVLTAWILSLVPLLSSAGRNFEYEYTFLISILLFSVYPHILLHVGKFTAKKILISLCLAPGTIFLTGFLAFRSGLCPCSEPSFYLWAAINIFPAWIHCHLITLWASKSTPAKAHRRLLTIQFGLILYLALTLWLNPQKRGFFSFLGYLHGPVYDELLEIDLGILFHAGASSAILLGITCILLGTREKKISLYLMACAFLCMGIYAKQQASLYPSAGVGHAVLQENLSEAIRTDGFTLHYQGKQDSKTVQRIFREASFHLGELKHLLTIDSHPHISIYLYSSNQEKKLLFGGGETDVTDVYSPSVHITAESIPHPSLRHELVHALLTHKSPLNLGFHPNIAITEGIAEALAPRIRTLDLDTATASLISTGKLKNIENLFSPLFWLEAGERSYAAAGSLLRYLLHEYGPEATLKLYGGASFYNAFGKSNRDIVKIWQEKIKKKYDASAHDFAANANFSSQGVLYELCPHSKAMYYTQRPDDELLNFQKPQKQDWLKNLEPLNKRLRHQDFLREARSLIKEKMSTKDLQQEILHAASPGSMDLWEHYLVMLRADLMCIQGDSVEAGDLLTQLAEQAKNYQKPVYYRLALQTRKEILTMQAASGWCKMLVNRQRPDGKVPSGLWLRIYMELYNQNSISESSTLIQELLQNPKMFLDIVGTDLLHEIILHNTKKLLDDQDFVKAQELLEIGLTDIPDSGYTENLGMLLRFSHYSINSF